MGDKMTDFGRVQLFIEKSDSEHAPWSIVQKNVIEDKSNCDMEDVWLLETEDIPLPEESENMEVGDMIVFEANLYGRFWQDYWGEWDSEFEFRNIENLTVYRPLEAIDAR